MYPIRLRPILACLFLAALLPVKAVHAEDILSLRADGHEPGLVSVIGPRGFITQLQVVDAGTLVEQVQVLRSRLIVRKQQLVQEVDEKQLDSGDALLTVLMPGGLLYAGYKKATYERARNDLAEISEDITEYSRDLSALAEKAASVTLALH